MTALSSTKPSRISFVFWGLFILSLTFIIPVAWAERATPEEMENVCQNWLLLNTGLNEGWRSADSPAIGSADDLHWGGMIVGRVYNISTGGFVVVPVLKEMPPVMAFSDKYDLDANQDEGMRSLISEVLYDRARMFIDTYGSLDAIQPDEPKALLGNQHRPLWDKFDLSQEEFVGLIKSGQFNDRDEIAGPLLTTAWHQGYPYNMYCPLGYGGNRCVVGCVATSAAQIFYFWQWPVTGEGSYTRYWSGDNSCDTTTPGGTLSADFSDPYIYDTNIDNLAELNYEVGVAFDMDYGVCGSGTYIDIALIIYPKYFKYMPNLNTRGRTSYPSADAWYYTIKDEIDAGRPMHYGINRHSIVCDGYRETGGTKYYHMNYGWGGSMNSWFAIDNLYCPWDGCSYLVEDYVYGIEPRWVWPEADITFGAAPLDVNFSTETELNVSNWNWSFGDGEVLSGDYPSAQHTYNTAGIFDLNVDIETAAATRTATRSEYIIVIADTIKAGTVSGEVGETVEIPVYGNNTIPLNKIVIPMKYSGTMQLRYDSCSIAGCRTEGFILDGTSIGSGFLKFEMLANSDLMEPGSGLLLKAYFTILSGDDNQTATISLNNIGTIYPLYKNNTNGLQYNPSTESGAVTYPGTIGDTNSDDSIDILDVVRIINYIYKDGPSPVPEYTANVNGDTNIDILDIVYLINYIYKQGPAPVAD